MGNIDQRGFNNPDRTRRGRGRPSGGAGKKKAKTSASPRRVEAASLGEDDGGAYMTGAQAAALLGIKRETLYAYASRGLVRSVPSASGRARRYARQDLLRLKARHDARSGHGAVAAGALRFGEPVLQTAISGVTERGPLYRGWDAIALAEAGASFEAVAEILWGEGAGAGDEESAAHGRSPARWPIVTFGAPLKKLVSMVPRGTTPIAALAIAVPAIAARDGDRHVWGGEGGRAKRRALLRRLACFVGLGSGSERPRRARDAPTVAEAVAVALGVPREPEAITLIQKTLVILADHELNASTFGVRVAASVGADLYACLSAGLGVLAGPEHGTMSERVEAMVREAARSESPAAALIERARRGERVPGWEGHPLYPGGDPRTPPLLAAARAFTKRHPPVDPAYATLMSLIVAFDAAKMEPPTVDLGLVAVGLALGLAPGHASGLFAVGRAAGWIAHAMEQRSQGFLLRPRARYVGPGPRVENDAAP